MLVNQLGSGLGTSPHSVAGPYGQGRFPRVRIGDDVVAQERLLREHLGVEQLALVFGGSMGAQQTYEWAVRFPDKVKRAAPLAGTARIDEHCAIFGQTLMDALERRPGLDAGDYERFDRRARGPAAARGAVRPARAVQRFWTRRPGARSASAQRRTSASVSSRRSSSRWTRRPAGPGLEVAARRRQPAHRW